MSQSATEYTRWKLLPSVQQQAFDKLCSFVFQSDEYPKALLVHGPPGCGKSALCRRFAQHHGYEVRALGFKQLADDDSGVVENTIMQIFRTCTAQSAKRTAILMDDIDLWAPNRVQSAWALRMVGAISDALEELREDNSQTVLLLTTCCALNDVHHSLLRRGKLGCIVGLGALSLHDRTEVCYEWMQGMSGRGMERELCRIEATQMASVTPGFMIADMLALLWRLTDRVARIGSNSESEEITRATGMKVENMTKSKEFRETLETVRPSLLAANSFFVGDTPRKEEAELYGLDTAVKQLQDCMLCVFDSERAHGSAAARHSALALRSIGACRGVLIHGPSGCGKTALLTKVCSSLSAARVNVLPIDSTAIVSSVVGDAERKMSHVFWLARSLAPCVLVLENIDNLAPNRSNELDGGGGAGAAFHRLLSTLLVLLDGGKQGANDGVLVVATAGHKRLVDDALLRAGRLDVHVEVHYPDAAAREAIFRAECARVRATPSDAQLRAVRGATITSAAHVRHAARAARRRNKRCAAAGCRNETR